MRAWLKAWIDASPWRAAAILIFVAFILCVVIKGN